MRRSHRSAAACAVGAALLLSACTGGASDEPVGIDETTGGELIMGLYADGDADAAAELIADGSVPEEIADDVRTSLEGVLTDAGDVQIADSATHDVDGVPIVEVDTSDGIRWCIRPDGRILLQCRVGLAEVEIDTGELDLVVVRAEVDVFPEEYQLRLQFRAAGDEPVQFPGVLALYGEDGNPASLIQTQAAIANGGQIVAQVERDTAALPGTTLLLAWVTDVGASLEGDLELRWDDGAMGVQVQETTWYVR